MVKSSQELPLPLEGIRVLEAGAHSAAYAAKLLADFGADVVTLEREGGDPLRTEAPWLNGDDTAKHGALFNYLRTNRRAMELPLADGELRGLLSRADVFITDLTDQERLSFGLETEALRATYPELLVVTISPFGAAQQGALMRGGELVTYGAGGLAQTSPGLPDGVFDPYVEGPLHPGGYPASFTAGLVAAVATLTSLPQAPEAEAAGDHLDISQQASVASLVYRYLAVTAYEGVDADRAYPGPLNMPNLYLPCLDGYVVIAAVLDRQWRRLVEAMGSPAWAMNPQLDSASGRNHRREEIELHLRSWCLRRDGDEIVELAARHGVPCFRFYRLDEMEASDHVVERESLVPVPGAASTSMPGAPFKLTRSPWRLRRPAPDNFTSPVTIVEEWSESQRTGSSEPKGGERGLPLEGMRVLDFGQVLAIPFGTQWMAWLGADVILVESERHLHTRATPPFADDSRDSDKSGVFNLFNSGKRSLTVDIKSATGRRILEDLVPHCDVVVENFRAGALDRTGLTFDRLRELRPDVILLALGAFGRSGPMKDAAGLHSAANLFSGLADVTRYPGGAPRIMGACLPDPLAGMNALLAVLLALQHRRRTGEGQFIDQAMYEGLLPFCAGAVMTDEAARIDMRRRGSQGSESLFSGYFPARGDGEWLALQVDTQEGWQVLTAHLGLDLPSGTEGQVSTKDQRVAEAVLISWLSRRELKSAIKELRVLGLAAARASTTSDLLDDEGLRAFGFVRPIDHHVVGTRWVPTLPWRMGRTLRFPPPPRLGEHVDDILSTVLGYDHGQIAKIRSEGILR